MALSWLTEYASVMATIQPVVPSNTGFGLAVYCADVAFDGAGAERWRLYTDTSTLATELAAAEINADVVLAVTTAFAQTPRPASVAVIRCDLDNSESAGVETYAIGLQAAVDGGLQFFYVCSESEVIADHVAIDAFTAAGRFLQICNDGDGDWKTSGQPAGYATIAASSASAFCFHPTSGLHYAFALAARMSAVDPDVQSPSFRGPVASIAGYSLTLTATTKAFLLANSANIMLPQVPGSSIESSGIGVAFGGERLKTILTKHWTEDRIETAIMNQVVKYEAIARAIPLDDRGVAIIDAVLEAHGQVGLRAGHYTTREDLPNGYEFSASIDVPNKRITVTGEYGLLDGVENFTVTADLTRTA